MLGFLFLFLFLTSNIVQYSAVQPRLYDFLETVRESAAKCGRRNIQTTITPTHTVLPDGFARNFNVNYKLVLCRDQKPKLLKKGNAKRTT